MSKLEVEKLFEELDLISQKEVIFPIDLFNLANRFSETKEDSVITDLVSKLKNYSNDSNGHGFARRVIYRTLGFAGKSEHPLVNLAQILENGLSDKNEWVQYNAAWVIDELGVTNDTILQKLNNLAEDYDGNKNSNPSDAGLSLKRQAFETLANIKNAS